MQKQLDWSIGQKKLLLVYPMHNRDPFGQITHIDILKAISSAKFFYSADMPTPDYIISDNYGGAYTFDIQTRHHITHALESVDKKKLAETKLRFLSADYSPLCNNNHGYINPEFINSLKSDTNFIININNDLRNFIYLNTQGEAKIDYQSAGCGALASFDTWPVPGIETQIDLQVFGAPTKDWKATCNLLGHYGEWLFKNLAQIASARRDDDCSSEYCDIMKCPANYKWAVEKFSIKRK